MKIKKGDKVSYLFWGFEQTARMKGLGGNGKIVFLDNGKWMHSTSLKKIKK